MTGRSDMEKRASSRPPISEQTRARMRQAKLGRRHTPEHNLKIAESMRRNWAETGHRDVFVRMSAEEHRDYLTLRHKGGFSRPEALRSIGRQDLLAEAEARVSAPGGGAQS